MMKNVGNDWIVLLGRRDEPTDGVRDYCCYLSAALARRGIQITTAEVRWAERGWNRGLAEFWGLAKNWKGRWVLVQYTTLAWSRRGFPWGAVAVMAVLRLRGARTAVVFHDWTGFTGPRWLDRLRWICQRCAMRRIARLAERNVLPVPPKRAAWLSGVRRQVSFIPIGANLPAPSVEESRSGESARAGPVRRPWTVGVFGVTEDGPGVREANVIAAAVKSVAARLGGLRLAIFGRGSEESRALLERALNGANVELTVMGLLPAHEVASELSRADAVLFVRGEILGHRGSAIAGIACGKPVIGYGDAERAFPLSEAGVVLVRPGDDGALTEALARVFTDDSFRQDLCARSRRAQAEYFSWDRIAQRFTEVLADD